VPQRPAGTSHLCETDLDLAEKARRGDEAAFHEIVDRYADRLFRLAFALTGNAADAEDVVQETFMGAFQGLGRFEARSSLKTWLMRICVRQAARSRKKAAAGRRAAEDRARAPDASPAGESGARLDVLEMLETLSPEHRDVLLLRERMGMTYQEIAETLRVPRGTVESRLFRAREALRERLGDYAP